MMETTKSVKDISQSVDGIASAIKIIAAIASNTNLLAMNAAIEAAHAGEAGRGFAVVADEIRRLSETTRDNSRNISQTLSSIIEGINLTSRRSSGTSELIDGMSKYIDGFAVAMTNFINTLNKLSSEGAVITSAMKEVYTHSDAVKEGYNEIIENISKIKEEMEIMSVQAQV
jgi:methyl-accepting chemotaxis protein